MPKLNRKNKGFTLLELMVVMGILAVLGAIIFPAVTGVKGTSVESQAKNDGDSTQKALERFNNQSIKSGVFPESTTLPNTGSYTFKGLDGASSATVTSTTHTNINWNAATNVWLQDGAVASMTFVPNFLNKQPESTTLKADEDSTYDEFLWLLKKEGAGSEVSRKVEVYRLKPVTDGGSATYVRLY